ncbi:hypothetical protein HPB48_016832 [Haemaphysalis longicornis]|uniref:Gamma-glutamyltransferase n=1 Tax=Haemaphysalis longicornis TaxID=44386 RepID=A0A9J6GCQ2_HAELO|nr:hypothetical protein HPB48_016832 [Haemaphysalis longicornis]
MASKNRSVEAMEAELRAVRENIRDLERELELMEQRERARQLPRRGAAEQKLCEATPHCQPSTDEAAVSEAGDARASHPLRPPQGFTSRRPTPPRGGQFIQTTKRIERPHASVWSHAGAGLRSRERSLQGSWRTLRSQGRPTRPGSGGMRMRRSWCSRTTASGSPPDAGSDRSVNPDPGNSGDKQRGLSYTTLLSVVAHQSTFSIAHSFGSMVVPENSGFLLNNQMDDFSTPGMLNIYNISPSEANYIVPGKRPQSSTAPTIIMDKDGRPQMCFGGSGGSRITSGLGQVAMRALWQGATIKEAIDAPRLHHQLLPARLEMEAGFPDKYQKELQEKGHAIEVVPIMENQFTGIFKLNGRLYANADFRKAGEVDGETSMDGNRLKNCLEGYVPATAAHLVRKCDCYAISRDRTLQKLPTRVRPTMGFNWVLPLTRDITALSSLRTCLV